MGESSALSEVTWCFIPGTPSGRGAQNKALSDFWCNVKFLTVFHKVIQDNLEWETNNLS